MSKAGAIKLMAKTGEWKPIVGFFCLAGVIGVVVAVILAVKKKIDIFDKNKKLSDEEIRKTVIKDIVIGLILLVMGIYLFTGS